MKGTDVVVIWLLVRSVSSGRACTGERGDLDAHFAVSDNLAPMRPTYALPTHSNAESAQLPQETNG